MSTSFLSSLLSNFKCNDGKAQSWSLSHSSFLVLVLKVVCVCGCDCVFSAWCEGWIKVLESSLIFWNDVVSLPSWLPLWIFLFMICCYMLILLVIGGNDFMIWVPSIIFLTLQCLSWLFVYKLSDVRNVNYILFIISVLEFCAFPWPHVELSSCRSGKLALCLHALLWMCVGALILARRLVRSTLWHPEMTRWMQRQGNENFFSFAIGKDEILRPHLKQKEKTSFSVNQALSFIINLVWKQNHLGKYVKTMQEV